jgi:hypothetical protein
MSFRKGDESACSHSSTWKWHSQTCGVLVPTCAVYCDHCGQLLFTALYDGAKQEHRLGFRNSHTVKWVKHIVEIFRKEFPDDSVVVDL